MASAGSLSSSLGDLALRSRGRSPGPFFFAWVGGDPLPAVDFETTGDLWSGSWVTLATVWGGSLSTTGDVLAGGVTVGNLRSVAGLVSGQVYTAKGGGIPSILEGALADTTLTYDGAGGGTLSQACTLGEGISLTLTNPAGTSTVALLDVSPLLVGETYDIAGSGILPGTTFVFGGGNSVDLDLAATATGLVSVTITNETGVDLIANLADTTGLVVGLTYDVFGQGLSAGAQATYTGGTTLALLTRPSLSGVGVALFVSKGKTYPDGGAFDELVHLVEDEQIFGIELTQAEGDFAALTIEVINPHVGLLAAGRNLWCWLSWRDAGRVVRPLFHGRLLGVEANPQGEVVQLVFVARPNDFVAQKIAIANGMRDLPWWDPLFLIDNIEDPDTVLETRTALWHIDPTTLVVTPSDILNGEDGTIEVAEGEHFYDAMTVTYGAAPLRRVNVSLAVSWTQSGRGDVDLTEPLIAAFRAAGSPYPWPKIASYTADGLLNTWPLPGGGIGGGWTVGEGTVATATLLSQPLVVTYTDRTDLAHVYTSGDGFDPVVNPVGVGGLGSTLVDAEWKPFAAQFALAALSVNLTAHFEAARKRSEIAEFVVEADVQSILTDPLTAEEDAISLSSAFVDQGIDPGGAVPLGDLRRNSYFPTDRGQQSLQFAMLLARAKLLARARAVDLGFEGTWDKLAGAVTCRKSVLLHDGRLPGGQATGKIKSWKLAASGDGTMHAQVTIGCSVGYGVAITPAAGVNAYIDDYIDGYYEAPGAGVSVVAGELVYQSLDGTLVIDDDGVDLFNMTPERALSALTITGGPDAQEAAINASLNAPGNVATETSVAQTGGAFLTNLKASSIAQVGTYAVKIEQATDFSIGTFTVTGPSGVIGSGIRGAPFKANGLSFDFPLGFLVGGGTWTINLAAGTEIESGSGGMIAISVESEPANSAGSVADPIGALGALPTIIEVDLVPVTGGDFESIFVLKVLPLTVPQTINLEAA